MRDADRPEVFNSRISFRDPVRDLQLWRSDSGDTPECIEELLKRQIPSPENVAIPRAASFGSKNVTFGTISHIDQVHTGVDVTKHLPAQKVDDDLAGWSRFDIEVPHRSARVYNHNRQPATRPVTHFFFGKELTSFVVSDHVGDLNWSVFVGGLAVFIGTPAAHRGGVYEFPNAFLKGRLDNFVRAFEIALIHLGGILAPQPVVSC